jgi:DNA topoisomerase-1
MRDGKADGDMSEQKSAQGAAGAEEAGKEAAPRKAQGRKTSAEKAPAKKAAARKIAAKKSVAGKAAAEDAPAGKAPAKKAASKKAPVKKSVARKSPSAPASEAPQAKAGVPVAKSKAGASKRKSLVIVESPAKARTIEKYLGSGYAVMASMGHLIDLPKSRLGIDVEKDFEPEYMTIRGKAKLLNELRKAAKKAKAVFLASDNDREGEAIAYHLKKAILARNPDLPVKRIVFNEITPHAIRESVKAPREVDESLVDAQKARRVLDRLVGYNLSPLLWKKVKNGLSAGRVQSVALRLICEREDEVQNFIPEEYWTLSVDFRKGRHAFSAELVSLAGQKPALKNQKDADEVVARIGSAACVVDDLREQDKTLRPKPPFTTSKLQQAAANRLGFTSKKTMQVAQQLYEGVAIGSTRIGLITYMRTDSVRVSVQAQDEARAYIAEHFPAELPAEPNRYESGGKAQDAHEAIRPTIMEYSPDKVQGFLSKEQLKLYTLVWERFMASQMGPAKTRTTSVDIRAGEAVFRVSATRVVEKGFFKVLKLSQSKEDRELILPEMHIGEELKPERFRPEQHFTQGPSRYTDASIIKALEDLGIGRPSTYAPTISVILERYYVNRENRQLVPTTLGRMINDMLVESFSDVLDYGFTAEMEKELDEVEEGARSWVEAIRGFYGPFHEKVERVMSSIESVRGSLDEKTDIVCEKCGLPMVKKLGRFGFFLACTGFPACRNTRSIPLGKCPRPGCDGEIVSRRKQTGRGGEFYGCSRYPECDFITHSKPTRMSCPKCGQMLVEKYDKRNGPHKACINPDCDYLHSADDEDAGKA